MRMNHRPSEMIAKFRGRFDDHRHAGLFIHAEMIEALLENLRVIENLSRDVEEIAEQAIAERVSSALEAARAAKDRKVILFPIRTAQPTTPPPDGGDAA
ncbi:hypothetical protein [Agrobacterium vitis]|uniref:hypothetical protein n=1 Tax=Agrobacterium vitis TaxID=373 RepID=UPI0015767C4E|nr:hypothetical protein G6L01_020970 [Agrobacterium vitis]